MVILITDASVADAMRLPTVAWIGAGIVAASGLAWLLGWALDGGRFDGALGFDAYLLLFFALPAGMTGLTVASGGFAARRPLTPGRLGLLVATAALAMATVWLWRYYWYGYCCSA